jgi:Calcineurin-like phosphoesterase
MTFYRLISDIHTEMWPENPHKALRVIKRLLPPMDGDKKTTLLLAGDTGAWKRKKIYGTVIGLLCERFREVCDIPGNHYWYGGTSIDLETPPAAFENYRFGSAYVHEDVVAATLWADFKRANPVVEHACETGMNDFKQIEGLSVEWVKAKFAEHVDFLRENIKSGCVVMTHFAPCWKSIPERHLNDPVNGYYASALEDIMLDLEPAVWCHGHIHTKCDYMVGKTRVIGNPAGYEGRDHDPRLRFDL